MAIASKRNIDSRNGLSQPGKKTKRSHCYSSSVPSFDAPKLAEYTPPPSPGRSSTGHSRSSSLDCTVTKKIDLEGINDDIVEAVIVQLQATGNRPHLVKELSMVLMRKLRIVQQSANPAAIISSRLAAYIKRPCWSAISPCPIAKELETVHPRRTYFYLTTCPAKPFVGDVDIKLMPPPRAIIQTPSISDEDDEEDIARRRQLSPSPEVDLSSPELDDFDDDQSQPATPVGSLPLPPIPQRHEQSHTRPARAPSPALEKDEREFTQTATGLQKRKLTGAFLEPVVMEVEDPTREDNNLFGEPKYLAPVSQNTLHIPFTSSPAIRPSFPKKDGEMEAWAHLDGMLEWDKSPESVELEELDGMLDQF
ncbi:hypothetical protein MKZ38_004305 [Zalerion maritima]|uniref:GDS1 winged helix domain-containing protein n=1 Tax=Zalerion maritima TaxID=339359 RepID=A0AAD5RMV9_9PEZI|nr:hypothetical protein MKZ38_004305 [Zalerion maritima]